MREEDQVNQARAFLDWYGRAGGNLVDALTVWANSKHFLPADERAIRLLIREWATGVWEAAKDARASVKSDEVVGSLKD